MFHYLNHRFHWKNFSFQIPDGFYLNSDLETPNDNTMWLISSELDFHLSIDVVKCTEGTLAALNNAIANMMPECILPIQPISINGLRGHYAEYHLSCSTYYEAWLQLEGKAILNIVIGGFVKLSDTDIAAIFAAIDPRTVEEM